MKTLLIALLTLCSLQCIADTQAASAAAFDKLKTLAGQWVRAGSNDESFIISFETSAKGSVLVENWIYNGSSHSLTLYHLDGDKLLATHYCPQGNQPRLKLDQAASEGRISFSYQDATNLTSINHSHQHSLALEITDANTLIRSETYLKAGEKSPSSLNLVRR